MSTRARLCLASASMACLTLMPVAAIAQAAPAGPKVGPSLHEAMPPGVRQAVNDSRGEPVAVRMSRISQALVGLPYTLDPLGEGVTPDVDPVVRYDTFDCLTFTEEVLALSLAADVQDAGRIRTELRYGVGRDVAYKNRRHFMELQWIPGVIADGYLVDTTATYGPVTTMTKQVGPEFWSSWSGRKNFSMQDDELPNGTMSLDVMSLDQALLVADQIREGSILLTVRVDRPTVPVWTTHVSLVVRDGDKLVMRHATKMGGGGTKNHGLSWYLKHLKTYKRWPVAGVAVLEPVAPPMRKAP